MFRLYLHQGITLSRNYAINEIRLFLGYTSLQTRDINYDEIFSFLFSLRVIHFNQNNQVELPGASTFLDTARTQPTPGSLDD
jgi:hypothetical protein